MEVESSIIKSILYDENSKVLTVALVSGKIYNYLRVPVSKFVEFLESPSKGWYYKKVIKDFPYKQVK